MAVLKQSLLLSEKEVWSGSRDSGRQTDRKQDRQVLWEISKNRKRQRGVSTKNSEEKENLGEKLSKRGRERHLWGYLTK